MAAKKKTTRADIAGSFIRTIPITPPKPIYVATVLKITHGSFFGKHSHYTTKIIEVDTERQVELIESAAKGAAEMSNALGLGKTEVLSCEKVDITTMAEVREKVGHGRSTIKK